MFLRRESTQVVLQTTVKSAFKIRQDRFRHQHWYKKTFAFLSIFVIDIIIVIIMMVILVIKGNPSLRPRQPALPRRKAEAGCADTKECCCSSGHIHQLDQTCHHPCLLLPYKHPLNTFICFHFWSLVSKLVCSMWVNLYILPCRDLEKTCSLLISFSASLVPCSSFSSISSSGCLSPRPPYPSSDVSRKGRGAEEAWWGEEEVGGGEEERRGKKGKGGELEETGEGM